MYIITHQQKNKGKIFKVFFKGLPLFKRLLNFFMLSCQ